ncbi:MAG: FG-GAP repeat protein [Candidatus Latescibacterota bacterium]|nr:FG-GAP repeat protein [Candidatus Latescibacterota bacterium]
MTRQVYTLLCCILLVFSGCGQSKTKALAESAKLNASDGEPGDYFGYASSTDGTHAIVGAYGDDDRGENAGAAYVFSINNSKWQEDAKLIPLQAHPNEQIGIAVSISGDFAWVGSRGNVEQGLQTGSAYVFRKLDEGWVQVARFRSKAGNRDDRYGLAVSVDGDWAAVGSYGDARRGRDAGSVYVYQLENESWRLNSLIYAPKGKEADFFGFSVDINGDRLIIGAFGDDDKGNRAGAAYIYKQSKNSWQPQVKLTALDGDRHNLFGHSVSLSGDLALVGAHGNRSGGKFSGAAYVFGRTQKGWRQIQKLEAPDKRANKYFGFSVDISPKRILIGARGDSHNGLLLSGSAYLFNLYRKEFGVPTRYIAQLPESRDFLGRSVSITDDVGLCGAHGDDDAGSLSGSVYTF